MRFVYHWNDVDKMSDEVNKVLEAAEDKANRNMDVKQVWWVPTPLTASFRFSDSYNEARAGGLMLREYPAVIEHSGQTFTGVFFVEYYVTAMKSVA